MTGEPKVPISYSLLQRILTAFLDMVQDQGARCSDKNLMEDLDREMAEYDRKSR